MSDQVNEPSQGAHALTAQQRLDTLLAQLNRQSGSTPPQHEGDPGVAPTPTLGELSMPLSRINEAMRPYRIEFDINSYENRTVAKVIDRDSGEVIRQIPREEILRIAESLSEMQGRLIDLEA
ncbi:flagellar protein FlaG [Aidingimonas lacisalsi]|uniref:flagellar protein FlaG n=1 Tax=Aidingimonas lacisalsi TaxID=2604086 RepID=UPI0011D1D578|nr:flagellar protein FlaG [Aidingimonas lacisalsi]